MSPDTNAYVAIPMEGMRMTSAASSARRRSSSNSKGWILGGLIAVVLLLLLGIPFLMRRVVHGFHDTMEQQMHSSDTIIMVIEEPVGDFLVEEPKIAVVLEEDKGGIVETNVTDVGQVPDDDSEYEEEPEDADEAIGDYVNEMDDELIKYEEDPNEGPGYYVEANQEREGVIDYEDELNDEEFIVDDVMFDIAMYEEVPDEVIDEWYAELFDDGAIEELQEIESFEELEEPFEELTKEDVVKVEHKGGN